MKDIGLRTAWTIFGTIGFVATLIFGFKACQVDYAYQEKMAELGYEQKVTIINGEPTTVSRWAKPPY